MNVFIKVHRCEFLRITTKVQKEVKQWVRAKCEHEGMLQQGCNLLMIKQENTQKWCKGDLKKNVKNIAKGTNKKRTNKSITKRNTQEEDWDERY